MSANMGFTANIITSAIIVYLLDTVLSSHSTYSMLKRIIMRALT